MDFFCGEIVDPTPLRERAVYGPLSLRERVRVRGARWRCRLAALFRNRFSRHFPKLWTHLLLLAFCTAIFAAPSPAADWADCRVAGPLVCRADFSLTPYASLLAELAQLQLDLARQLGIPPAAEPIEVYLFHDQATYARYVSRFVPGVPYRRAIYAKGRGPGRVFAYRGAEFATDLRHECTHALLHAALSRVPLWLDEGLAGCFELPGDRRPFDSPHLAGVCENVRRGIVPSLEALEKKDELAEMGQIEYRDAWAWVHFMLYGPAPARQALTAYLADLRQQKATAELSRRLRDRMPDLEEQFARHFRTWRRQD